MSCGSLQWSENATFSTNTCGSLGLKHEFWLNVPGSNLDLGAINLDFPTGSRWVTWPEFKAPSNWAGSFVQRLAGVFTAPVDAVYDFHLFSVIGIFLFRSTLLFTIISSITSHGPRFRGRTHDICQKRNLIRECRSFSRKRTGHCT